MWISSQDKTVLKDCNCLVVEETEPSCICEFINQNLKIRLGEYKTEERAKEVLYQIRRQIETNIASDTVLKGVRTESQTVFQMPRE